MAPVVFRFPYSSLFTVRVKCAASSPQNLAAWFPCQLSPVRWFRCTGMEAAEMCHRWRCRRREELCAWRDAQRKERVGCRDVYKEETGWLLAVTQLVQTLELDCDLTRQTGLWASTHYVWSSLSSSFLYFCAFSDLLCLQAATEKQLNRFQPQKRDKKKKTLVFLSSPLIVHMATSVDTLPAHLLPLVMEEFPHSLATACVCRAGQREPRLRCVQCGVIEEEEEDCSTLEEDQAQRSFLQTVESLRRSTRWAPPAERVGAATAAGFHPFQPPDSPQHPLVLEAAWWSMMSAVLWMQFGADCVWGGWKLLGHLIWQWMCTHWVKELEKKQQTKYKIYWSVFRTFFY